MKLTPLMMTVPMVLTLVAAVFNCDDVAPTPPVGGRSFGASV
ncbi:MAG: hypothetical protein ABUL77_02400 [Bacteroidota bacterium]